MENTVKKGNKIFVSGRAGELTGTANTKTFALLEKIFGYRGPYRTVLQGFGIGNKNYKKSFLKLIDGQVLVDIERENKALWKSCMYKLVYNEKNKKTQLKLNLTFFGVLHGFVGFLKKTTKETLILNNLKKHITLADKKYKNYCDVMKETLEKGCVHEDAFLRAYKNVVYITYLYELLFAYNQNNRINFESLDRYVQKNDYLLMWDESYAEFLYKPKEGFGVGDKKKRKVIRDVAKLNLIPNKLPNPSGDIDFKYKAEKKLQCLKNNIRLKTGVLLYFLE